MVFVCRLMAFCLVGLALAGGTLVADAAAMGEKRPVEKDAGAKAGERPGKPARAPEKSRLTTSKQTKTTSKRAGKPTLRKMVGQMLMLGFPGTKPDQSGPREARRLLASGDIGGLIFMGENLVTKAQVAKLVDFVKSGQQGKLVPFIGIDQEGGKVQRLNGRHGFTDIPTARAVAGEGSIKAARETYEQLAGELEAAGFNVNFGPVVDLDLVPTNPIIGAKERSYGKDPVTVRRFARAFVKAHRHRNMLTALKHFPGHGSSWTDSHEQFVDLTTSWKRSELKPYQSMVRDGLVDFVMVGHLFHPEFTDGEKLPASLSRKAIEGNLRQKIGFDGLVITDDLGMGAVKKYIPFEQAVVHAVNAGNDILLLAAGHPATKKTVNRIHRIIAAAVKAGRIDQQTIKRSYERIVAVKTRLALGENKGL